MKPTYEELEAELRSTKELLKKALDEIDKLKERLNRNSKNSSKPHPQIRKLILPRIRKPEEN